MVIVAGLLLWAMALVSVFIGNTRWEDPDDDD